MRPCEDIFYKLEIGCATAREQKQCPVRKIKRASGAKLYQVGWYFLGEGTMRNEEVNARPPVSRHCRKSVKTNQAMDYKQHFYFAHFETSLQSCKQLIYKARCHQKTVFILFSIFRIYFSFIVWRISATCTTTISAIVYLKPR